MKATLKEKGWTPECKVVVILDWFHISVRLRPIEQMATKVVAALCDGEPDMASFVRLKRPNVRHQMWNGRWHAAITRMKSIYQGTHEATNTWVNANPWVGHVRPPTFCCKCAAPCSTIGL